jgi:hypothetical protein
VNNVAHGDQPHASVAATSDASVSTRLRGWRLMVGRAGWLVLVLFFVSPYVAALPGYLSAIEHPTAFNVPLSYGAVAALASSGVSLTTYAWMCEVVLVVGLLVSVTTGVVLFWRRGDDWMALVVALFVAIHPIGIASTALNVLTTQNIFHITVGWLPLSVIAVMESALQFSVMLLFPSGRFVPRWSWLLVILMSAAAGLASVQTGGYRASNLIGLAYPPLLGVAVACMVYRYRHVSTPVQRLQTKWIIVGLVVTPLGNLAFWLPTAYTPLGQTLYAPLAFLVYLLVQLVTPLAVFIAVQRYRLYQIDTLINRALVYGSLTVILGTVYAGTVIGAQALLSTITRDVVPEQPILLVVTTLLIAALLRPLRRWLQATVDRRFYRRKYDASRTLAEFSTTLRQETDVVALRERLLTVVGETMQPAHVSLWLLPAHAASITSKQQADDVGQFWPVPSTVALETGS